MRTAHGLWTTREGVLVQLETSEGRRGWGEAAPIPGFGTGSVEEVERACLDLGDHVGEDWRSLVPETVPTLRFALWSAEQALRVEPTEPGFPSLPVAALLPAGKTALERVSSLLESGFRSFKWKVGVGDIRDELGILDDLLARLPGGAKLRTDANGAWESRRAQQWMQACAERPVEFVEQPVAPELRGSEDVLLGLAGEYPTPVALDESIASAHDVSRWLERGWPGVYVVKPSLLGEPQEILQKLARVKASVVFSSALETAAGAQAALSLAFHYSLERHALGFGVWPLFEDGRCNGPALAPYFRIEDVQRLRPEQVWNALS